MPVRVRVRVRVRLSISEGVRLRSEMAMGLYYSLHNPNPNPKGSTNIVSKSKEINLIILVMFNILNTLRRVIIETMRDGRASWWWCRLGYWAGGAGDWP